MPENGNSYQSKNIFKLSSKNKDQIEYISDLLLELADMARAKNLHVLAEKIEIARKEAELRSRD